ncbi:MAG: alpha/beta fold hydrolase [Myxococcales bacterium]|nr:MAG: alpha/beta fold hydrolase [Myxococcales bacterium]
MAVLCFFLCYGCDDDEVRSLIDGVYDPALPGPWDIIEQSEEIELDTIELASTHLSVMVFRAKQLQEAALLVFCHGFGSDAQSYAEYGRRAASHGFTVIIPTFDQGFLAARTHLELLADLKALLATLRSDPARFFWDDRIPIGLAGHSRGGKQALHAAIDDATLGVSWRSIQLMRFLLLASLTKQTFQVLPRNSCQRLRCPWP